MEPIKLALHLLTAKAPNTLHHADTIAALGKPVTWGTIAHWIYGREPMPQWAIDRVRERLQWLDNEVLACKAKATKEEQGARHWRAYHARRARERDEAARKEKGAL